MPSDAEDGALRDILHHIGLARQFTEGCDYETFHDDTMRVYAVTRCLEIISEASRRLTDELKARHPGIAWKEMAGAGNGATRFVCPAGRDRTRTRQNAVSRGRRHIQVLAALGMAGVLTIA